MDGLAVWRYLLHRHLFGREAANAELYDHLDISELCRIAIRDALESGEFDEAERLCMEKINAQGAGYYRCSDPDGLFSYGSCLMEDYPQQLYGLCEQVIRENCAQARNWREYKKVARQLGHMMKWGGTDAAYRLIDELAQTYPRKAALLDELQKEKRR